MGAPRVAVAASGGRDSTALLHATARAAASMDLEVVALHVHHGLSAQADAWLGQLRRQCRRWGCALDWHRLAGAPAPGDSVEAWARAGRYAALAEMARAAGCDMVLLAHHRRDQAETWLLQALRGGGAAGLSAMPRLALRDGIVWARPWLDQSRGAIDAYVRRHRLRVAEDPSNAEPRLARNRLRLLAWPALAAAFPDLETTLSAAARHAQHAAALADEVAALDLPPLLDQGRLVVARWCALPPARRLNALRAWLALALPQGVPASLVDRLVAELPEAGTARWPAPQAQLALYRGRLQVMPEAGAAGGAPAAQTIDLSRPGETPVPGWPGRFATAWTPSGGIAPSLLGDARVAPRAGGERFRLAPGAAARPLKKQFQARAVPAWARGGPVLYSVDQRLLFVPGLGVDAGAVAPAGTPQLSVDWLPDVRGAASPPGDTAAGR